MDFLKTPHPNYRTKADGMGFLHNAIRVGLIQNNLLKFRVENFPLENFRNVIHKSLYHFAICTLPLLLPSFSYCKVTLKFHRHGKAFMVN